MSSANSLRAISNMKILLGVDIGEGFSVLVMVLLPLTHHLHFDLVLGWVLYQCHQCSDLIRVEWAAYAALSTVTVVDILIASSMWYLLATPRTGFFRMDSFINKLITYTVNTGCITSIGSVATTVTVRST
ncbi:uncharacterized protein F5147DRAFT_25903 [Suillus discolor]|uniref:DUF6534 domain-containing protein n=1 Tax=Suillus discolor TaxID=1912936 RepID=A0A9P7ETV8_9AGAM|nr:uncharacterized protein F5147DRAFT_25903 [Suillus discolor]KAG2090777.1 hypothetical protein F5147DRAFT_25903 [Suillus discolor]